MKRRIIVFLAALALMVATAAPALAGPPALDDPAQGCENSDEEKAQLVEDYCDSND